MTGLTFLAAFAAIMIGGVLAFRLWQRLKSDVIYWDGSWKASTDTLTAANQWVGPYPYGVNHSVGVPRHPAQSADGKTWFIDFPTGPADHLDAITEHYGPLTGKAEMRLPFTITAGPGASLQPFENPAAPPLVSLYFQRAGDDWSGDDVMQDYRWYAMGASIVGVGAGSYEIVAPLDGALWGNVQGQNAATRLDGFRAAITNAKTIGIAFGWSAGASHGLRATGPVRFETPGIRVA